MTLLSVDFSLPLQDNVLVFALVLSIILFAPILLKKLRIPGIIGLIIAGVIIGPHGTNLLVKNSSIDLFGTIGLLYIMFLAGLEIDLNDFIKNKNLSLFFGTLTFLFPLCFGTAISFYFLKFSFTSSILLASMFASHTLITYPIISRLGLTKSKSVTMTIGGTIITDTAVLLVLAVITGSAKGGLNSEFWIRLGISLLIFVLIVLIIIPRIGRWFFRKLEGEGSSQFVFVLAVVFTSAFLAELAGVEPIIGAFLAGLALNRLIPHTSALMNRIVFVGNTLFIPFFLINVGMLVDLHVLFNGSHAFVVAGTIIIAAYIGKWLASFVTQKIFRFSAIERKLIFGMSTSHAAATLAVVLVGFKMGLFNENTLNGTILLILITCLVSSFIVENNGRKLAIIEGEKKPDMTQIPQRILIPISNPNTIERLIDLAFMIKNPKSKSPLYPLVVVKDDEEAREKILANDKMLEKLAIHASALEQKIQNVSRVDINVSSGIIRAIKELIITDVIIGWNAAISATDRIFGSVLDNLLQNTDQMIFVTKIIHPLNTLRKIITLVPENAELEIGFSRWIKSMKILSDQTGSKIIFFSTQISAEKIKSEAMKNKFSADISFQVFDEWQDFLMLSRDINPDDLIVMINARPHTISYNPYLDNIPKKLAKHFQRNSFVVIYPEQNASEDNEKVTQLNDLMTSPIEEIDKLRKRAQKTLGWKS
ncbi:MAG: cation:proton antiporter [Bacteroidia bacterium]